MSDLRRRRSLALRVATLRGELQAPNPNHHSMTLGVARPSIELLAERPTSAMAEADLVRGYAGPTITRPCLCGGSITARVGEADIAEAVAVHNASAAHAAWAIQTGWRHEAPG